MTLLVLALSTAVLLSVGGPALLRGLGRACRPSTRSTLALWVLSPLMWLLTWGALVLMLVAQVMGPGVKGVIAACLTLIQALHRNGAEAGVSLALVASMVALARLLWVALRQSRAAIRWRRDHQRDLAACATSRVIHRRRVWLVESGEPSVYCVPGGRFGIVITRGAVDALTPREMRAVMAHEHAHLRGRHHLLVAWVRLLDAAFPRVPLLRAAAQEVPVLVEWAADDRAARLVGVPPLVHALGAMATSRSADGAAALAISGACTVQRVRRLLNPSSACAGVRSFLLIGAALAALAAPPALTVASTVVSVAASHCACTV
ncbi:Zn-dependent protease with chaperone function [Spinactinospora alkalitolerans]|uniref:Zn-dependent protease with chaperone function n=1 Tax=Spinactinospora alkalitolerans TaxID=687207 RepID=A0A852U104_9ACTN|nr:M56 family metallopeptidase [Spinactinospora alkalitolerans]NYE47864.1 Zn-dependent protease with chaperone function [Spinactinospora alkalitolerans]